AAPSAGGAASPGRPNTVRPVGSDAAGQPGPAPAAFSLVGVPRHPRDAAAVASRAGPPPVDLSAAASWQAAGGGDGAAGAPAGTGEPALGLPAHRRGVPQAAGPGVSHLGAYDPAPPRPRPGTP